MVEKDIEIDNENEEIPSSQNNSDEPVISPKNNDELLIEFEDTKNINEEPSIEISNEIEDEINEELIPENEEVIEDNSKKLNQKAAHKKNHHKKPAPKPSKPETPKEPGEKKSKKGLIYALIIILVLGAGAYIFVLKPHIVEKFIPALAHSSDSVDTKKVEKHQDTTIKELPEGIATKEEIDAANSQPEVTEDVVVSEITKELEKPKQAAVIANSELANNQTLPERVVTKAKLQIPCWVIGYASVSKEHIAIKTVAQLTSLGKPCGYYWIPDYLATGPKMYKVYVGPYDTKEAAIENLESVKKSEPAAYVMQVK